MNASDHVVGGAIADSKHESIHWLVMTAALGLGGAPILWMSRQEPSVQGWCIAVLMAMVVGLSYLLFVFWISRNAFRADVERLSALKTWIDVEKITGLQSFSPSLQSSVFHPETLLKRIDIQSLRALGNGCSKWTSSGEHSLRLAANKCQAARRKLQFLLQHPEALVNRGGNANAQKAVDNAKSALILRGLQKLYPDTVEIKTYKHTAELRITILNETDVTVGHYAAGAGGNSNETPLLNFHDDKKNRWSFARAFMQHFEAEWCDATVLTDWAPIEKIANGGQRDRSSD